MVRIQSAKGWPGFEGAWKPFHFVQGKAPERGIRLAMVRSRWRGNSPSPRMGVRRGGRPSPDAR